MMKVLVIGSEGNVARILVPYLEKVGHEVVCADILRGYRKGFYQIDITSGIDLVKIFEKERPEVVYSLAAMVSRVAAEENSIMTMNLNVSGLNNIVELCKLYNSKLVSFSTSEIYGNLEGVLDEDHTRPQPNNRYGLAKYLGEKIVEYEVKNNGLRAVILRPFMLYHENCKVGDINAAIIEFALKLSRKEKINVHTNSERAWLHLDDGVIAMEKAMHLDHYEIINIGTDEYIKTQNMAKKMAESFGLDIDEYANYIELPGKMTLVKRPNLDKMHNLLMVKPTIGIEEGIQRIASSFKSCRL